MPENSITIKVFEITGEYAIASAQGQKLYEFIRPTLQLGQQIEIDFSGVKVYGCAFFNHGIGQLLKDFAPSQLNESIDMAHLPSHASAVMREVIANAKRFYGR